MKSQYWHNIFVFIALSIGIFLSPALSAQLPQPKSGIDVDQTQTVNQRHTIPKRCIAVSYKEVTLFLPEDNITRMASAASESQWQTEQQRLNFINASRAKELLSMLSAKKDAMGCKILESNNNTEYLILHLIETGRVFARSNLTSRNIKQLRVRYVGNRCGHLCGFGVIMLYIPEEKSPFLSISWWVS